MMIRSHFNMRLERRPVSATMLTSLMLAVLWFCSFSTSEAAPPNVVLINADDLGYGDVGAYGAKRIATPNIDRLATEGLRFTNGYSTSATCTPSRYSLMTGEYAWRRKGTGILPGDASLIIPPGTTTLPAILQRAGYRTGVVGKWHLGLGAGEIDWNENIQPGPLEIGFDESFIMAATGDRAPCVYVRNHQVVGLEKNDPLKVHYQKPFPGEPTGKTHPELLKIHPSHGHDMSIVNGISRIGYFTGGKTALWKDEEMADTFTAEAVRFLEQHQAIPFFLYFALHDPHVPRVPHPRFVGKTQLGPRGDAIVQADWCVGEILNTLDRLKLSGQTVVILTSDNGPVVDDGYQDQAVEKLGDHSPGGPLRGGKYSRFEAGTRVPFIVRWTDHVSPGVSDAVVSQIDLPATLAALVDIPLQPGEVPDSFNLLPAVLGKSPTGRSYVVQQGTGGLALRSDSWKYIPPSKGPAVIKNTGIETANAPLPQLYDLSSDPGERTNLAGKFPEQVQRLQAQLEQVRAASQTRP
ncbi:MAG TPA: sulfatase-like hydrolase/transferase [Planctomicrobium sp.]|nr:sulfatase-like hydrolase/transferase [Planctomicrobium sp.]